jgi:anti-sigma regulatory factor (Ser/Thr protein kinase)
VFPGRADQVSLARRFVIDALGARSPLGDEVSLLVSEAVTNALLHTSSGHDHGTFTVIYLISAQRVHVEVHDGGAPHVPRRRMHDLESTSGRGLELFEALADRWGYGGDEHGRVVWFELDLDEHMGPRARAGTAGPGPARP